MNMYRHPTSLLGPAFLSGEWMLAAHGTFTKMASGPRHDHTPGNESMDKWGCRGFFCMVSVFAISATRECTA
jgi:hypothetical protein